jgi:hypothetical protein
MVDNIVALSGGPSDVACYDPAKESIILQNRLLKKEIQTEPT